MNDARRRAGARRRVSLGSGAAAALAALAFLVPAAAEAHTGSAAVSCTGADFAFTLFAPGSNTVHYDVSVDGVSVAHGDDLLDQNGGREGVLHVPLTLTGTHVVRANAWWGPQGVADHNTRLQTAPPLAYKKLNCPPPPPVVPVVPVVPTTPAPAPVAAPAPAGAVAGVVASAPARSARVAVATRCASRTARVTVTGRSMRDVTLFVNGRRVRTVRIAAGTTRVRVSVPIVRGRAQTVTARVRFRNGGAPRTLVHRAVRCAAAAVQPQFTG
jgi:hypothetical protein